MPDQPELRQRLAAVLWRHQRSIVWNDCLCGGKTEFSGTAGYFAHVADVLLALPGIAIVQLPEPISFDTFLECVGRWRVGQLGSITAYADGYMIDETCRDLGGPQMAREFAAALLAAADAVDAAEAQTND